MKHTVDANKEEIRTIEQYLAADEMRKKTIAALFKVNDLWAEEIYREVCIFEATEQIGEEAEETT